MSIEPITILIADDNEDELILMEEALAVNNVINVVKAVRDGQEVLDFLRHKGKYAGAKLPGLVLLDIRMPQKSGLEVLEEIKQDPELQHLPVVMVTSSDLDSDILRAYRGGACSYIRKPIDLMDFRKVISQFSLYLGMVSTIPRLR